MVASRDVRASGMLGSGGGAKILPSLGWKYPPDSSELSPPSREGDLSGLESEGRTRHGGAQAVAAVRHPN